MVSELLRRMLLGILVIIYVQCPVYAQLRYPIVGAYKGKSAQGMAIWGDVGYLFNHGGRCRVFNLQTGIVDNEFLLESADSTNHVNNACFGLEKTGNGMPLLYISECKPRRRCFVETLNDTTSVLVQTIEARKANGLPENVLTWVVDSQNGYLYGITRNGKDLNTTGIVHNYLSKYRLPRLSEGDSVIFGPNDLLERFEVQFPNILQGAKVKDGKMYIVTGLQESASERRDARRAIQIVDLESKTLVKTIDLTYVTVNEPEDMDFYDGTALLYCGQQGGIYEVDLK